jgi:phospholipase C
VKRGKVGAIVLMLKICSCRSQLWRGRVTAAQPRLGWFDQTTAPDSVMTMPTRRDFLEMAAGLAAGAGSVEVLFDAVGRAYAIEPAQGSNMLDAEHVVILMQENRSFDHAFGTLRGVRGFNDPRAVTLPDGNPVWVQADANGNRYTPFRFDIKASKATWMGCLPHGWTDQVDTRNHGLHDKWLPEKRSGNKDYADLPLTMGYYTRQDIPFYFALLNDNRNVRS